MGIAIGLAAAILAIAATSCGSEGADVVDTDDREAGVYAVVLDWLIEGADLDRTGPDGTEIFVASRSEVPIDVDVQVTLVESFVDKVPLRFVDVWTEAVVENEADLPTHEGTVLVGLGAVDPDGDIVEVYADRYFSVTRAEAWIVTLEGSDDSWAISGQPQAGDIRPFSQDS